MAEIAYEFTGELTSAYEHPLTHIVELADTQEEEDGVFVRLHSWSSNGEHKEFDEKLRGKKVRITVEVIDEQVN